MNRQLATIILDRIMGASFSWLDPASSKFSGLVRPISFKLKSGKTEVFPIAADVEDAMACNAEGTPVGHMLPDSKYATVLFIESDTRPTKKPENIGNPSYTSKFRVVVWMNCNRFGGDPGCGDVAYENLVSLLDTYPFDSAPFKFIVMQVTGGAPIRGKEVFGKYPLNEERSQYAHYPYDYFALEVQVDFILPRNCENELEANAATC